MDFIQDIWQFMRVRKKFWLLPALFVLLVVGAIVFVGGSSAAAPFIYTIF